MTEFDKRSTTPDIFRSKFREILPRYDGFCKLYTDGSKSNEQTASAYYTSFGTRAFRISNNASIFSAEIEAIRAVLNYIKVSWLDKFVIFSDSKSVLESIELQDSSNPLIIDMLQTVYKLINKQKKVIEFCWVPSHVGIQGNEEADAAAKAALNLPIPVNFPVPYTDHFPKVKTYINNCWQLYWNSKSTQKLYEMMPLIGNFNVNCLKRKEQVVIHRIRIGHTRLTHSHKMEGRPAPRCVLCNEEITVKHFMLHCRRYCPIRTRYFNVNGMYDLFNTVPLRTIIAYIKEIGLFNEL